MSLTEQLMKFYISEGNLDSICVSSVNAVPDTVSASTFSDHLGKISRELNPIVTESYNIHPDMPSMGVAVTIIFAVLIAGLIIAICCLCSKKLQNCLLGRIFWGCFIIIFGLGIMVYDIGMYTQSWVSLITNIPMAIVHSVGMFLLSSDVSEIQEKFHHNVLFMGCFSAIHALAAVFSFILIIKFFGFNLEQRFKIWKFRWLSKKHYELFIFWGFNDATRTLITDINSHYKSINQEDKYKIIVVRTGDENESDASGLNKLLHYFSANDTEIDTLRELKCMYLATNAVANKVNPQLCNNGASVILPDILGKEMHLWLLRKLIKKRACGTLHLLLLSENAEENLHTASLLANDELIHSVEVRSNITRVTDVKIYCHARYNTVHRVIEDELAFSRLSVNVIDSSHISVEELKNKPEVLPVNFVEVKEDATVDSEFHALVVGFSEVGQDITRFLYEFGAFVRAGSTSDDVRRSPFHLDVVDSKMENLAGTFVANSPGIPISLPYLKGRYKSHAPISLHSMNCNSAEFYLKIEERIKYLNYIVIATEDDELNISCAVRIFRLATRYRTDNLEKLCILVRIHNDDDGHFRRIAVHYNCLWKAYLKRDENNYNTEVMRRADVRLPIYIFGEDIKTYTFRNIIDNRFEKEAASFYKKYEETSGNEIKLDNDIEAMIAHVPEEMKHWERRRIKFLQLKPNLKKYSTTLQNILRLRRDMGQDFANSQHISTKILLADKALEKLETSIDWTSLERRDYVNYFEKETDRPVDEPYKKILDTLAQTEHLRWNASHELLGYVRDEVKDDVRLKHKCIVAWQNLENDTTRGFDYNVADVSFTIHKDKNNTNSI